MRTLEDLKLLEKQFGSVEFEGKTLYFLQDPDVTHRATHENVFVATDAVDEAGNEYLITWKSIYDEPVQLDVCDMYDHDDFEVELIYENN